MSLVDDGGNRVPCLLKDSQVAQLRALRPRQLVRLEGIFVPPSGNNQLLLHQCEFVR